jgi:hypothetical protein
MKISILSLGGPQADLDAVKKRKSIIPTPRVSSLQPSHYANGDICGASIMAKNI